MDQKLLFLINREWTHPLLDRFMAIVSSFDLWTVPLIVLVIFLLKRGGFTGRAMVLTALLVVAINDGLVSRTLKHLVDRPRPHQALSDVRQVELAKARPRLLALSKPMVVKMSRSSLKDVEGRSFPSSHTINTISVALVAIAFYRRALWVLLPALLVAYSRVYTGSHWPSDVLTSLFLGLGVTCLWLAFFEAAWRRFGPKLMPQSFAAHPTLFHK